MAKLRVTLLALATMCLALSPPLAVASTTQHSKPKITMEQARATALHRVPGGKVHSAELEHEHGRLIYSFDIAVPGRSGIEEVQVDANHGNIVSQAHESSSQEKKEAQKEKQETKQPSKTKQ